MRLFARNQIEKEYGEHWQFIISTKIRSSYTTTKFEQLHYHQLLSFYKVFLTLTTSIPSNLYPRLFQLTPTRNNIAHNHLIFEK